MLKSWWYQRIWVIIIAGLFRRIGMLGNKKWLPNLTLNVSGYAVANPTYATVIAKSVNRGMKDAEKPIT